MSGSGVLLVGRLPGRLLHDMGQLVGEEESRSIAGERCRTREVDDALRGIGIGGNARSCRVDLGTPAHRCLGDALAGHVFHGLLDIRRHLHGLLDQVRCLPHGLGTGAMVCGGW